jgi:GAF domain-containing protein
MNDEVPSQRTGVSHEMAEVPFTAEQIDVTQEQALWTAFAEASSMETFCQSWLALQCRMMGAARAGIVLLGPPDRGPFRPVATWPDGRHKHKHLSKTAEKALTVRRRVVSPSAPSEGDIANGRYEIGYPIEARGALHGVVVIQVLPISEASLQGLVRQVQWGTAWMEVFFSRQAVISEREIRERMQRTLDLVATAVGHDRFYASAMAVVTALAAQLQCERVSVGFLKRGRAHVVAVSHSAEFKTHANVTQGVADAMDEAIDQRETIVYPPLEDRESAVVIAHEHFAKEYGGGSILTVPLESGGQPVGALLLERSSMRPFDSKTVELCRSVGLLVGPLLEVQRREDRWLGIKAWESFGHFFATLLGPRHVALKLTTMMTLGVLAFCVFAQGDYRVSAKTVLEPIVQRAAAAPFDGYIREAPRRAGDLVHVGDLLCTLDDRELRLERLKALSKFEEYQKEYHKAMAEREAAKAEIFTAQMKQVQSEMALLDDKLAHTHVLSPFEGIVVSGDLSQQLGSPVEKGKVLFEIAPLDSYRIVLEVDERDIVDVRVGQRGNVLLSAFPSDPVEVTVQKVTPVSTAKEGRNFFRVEASLAKSDDRLRPAMEGAGKIDVDRRLMVWIWTHQVVDWVRLAVWTWLP